MASWASGLLAASLLAALAAGLLASASPGPAGAGGGFGALFTTTTPSEPPAPTTAAPGECSNTSSIGGVVDGGGVYGKGMLRACTSDGLVVEVYFEFYVYPDEVVYEGAVEVWGGAVAVHRYPLTLALETGDGGEVVVARASGGPVEVNGTYSFRYTASPPEAPLPPLDSLAGVTVEVPVSLAGRTLTLRASGPLEAVMPICTLEVKVVLNKTRSWVEAPEGFAIIALQAPPDAGYDMMVQAFNGSGAAVVRASIGASADLAGEMAAAAGGVLGWLLSHGVIVGVDGESLTGAARATAAAVEEYCKAGGSRYITVYWNGTAWAVRAEPLYTPLPATPTPTPTQTTVETTSYTTLPATTSEAPGGGGSEEPGSPPGGLPAGTLGAGRGQPETPTTPAATTGEAGTPAGGPGVSPGRILAALAIGAAAALAAWALARRA